MREGREKNERRYREKDRDKLVSYNRDGVKVARKLKTGDSKTKRERS